MEKSIDNFQNQHMTYGHLILCNYDWKWQEFSIIIAINISNDFILLQLYLIYSEDIA